ATVPAILKGKKARVDPLIDFSGGEFTDTGPGRATDLRVKWSGALLAPRPGRYHIVADTGDPVRVLVDGKVVIDTKITKTGKRDGTVVLGEKPATIVIEFSCLNTEKHHLKLCWIHAGTGDAEA